METGTSGSIAQWLPTVLVPVCTIAIGWFSYIIQGKMADRVESTLKERMDTLEKHITTVTNNLGENIKTLKGDVGDNIKTLKGDLGKEISELRTDLKSVGASTARVETKLDGLNSYLEKLINAQVKAAVAEEKQHRAAGD